MKKTGITAMIMSVAMLGISVGPAFSANAADETEAAGFAESVDSFFVVVGTYSNEYTRSDTFIRKAMERWARKRLSPTPTYPSINTAMCL